MSARSKKSSKSTSNVSSSSTAQPPAMPDVAQSGNTRSRSSKKLSEREKLQRDIAHTETLVKNYRTSLTNATSEQERTSLQSLLSFYTSQLATMTQRLSQMNDVTAEQRRKEALVAAVRRMGKALPSKTLEENPELLAPLRETLLKALPTDDLRSVFLAGIGSAQQDLAKSTRKRNKSKRSRTESQVSHEGDESPAEDVENGESNNNATSSTSTTSSSTTSNQ